MKKIYLVLFSLLSGLIWALGWPERGFPGLLFIGLVPLLYVEYYIGSHRERFIKFSLLFYAYPAFFIWNLLTTWWIFNSTSVGAILAVVLNSLFLTIVFQLFSWIKHQLSSWWIGYLALISGWISFEFLHLNWILTWPWLNLGNGFASYYKWVQWYEYTGTMGGTLWILIGNILAFETIRNAVLSRKSFSSPLHRSRIPSPFSAGFIVLCSLLLLGISIPLLISFRIYRNYQEKPDPVSFVVVQPNLDPYSEQYAVPPSQVIGQIMNLARPLLDSGTNFLIAPESAIQESMWENDLSTFQSIRLLERVIDTLPRLNILIGGSTFRVFEPGEVLSRSARKFTNSPGYYDAFNTAILLNATGSLQLYHKSRLTPGVEALPSFRGFKWLENFALDMGGTVGSLGTDTCRKVYQTVHAVGVSPIICYESVFGEFFGEFVKNGARIMIIITNDGWWGNTPGHRQHFAFAHLRAIETRRSIARSANTGISAFIDQRGDAQDVTGYWVPAVIKGTLNANDSMTFYVKHGDFLARIAVWILAALALTSLVFSVFIRKQNL